MNSIDMPSSPYEICIGLDGCEYNAFTMTFVIPACATIALKSLTLTTMCNFSSTVNSPNSRVSTAIVVWSGCFKISRSVSARQFHHFKDIPLPDIIFSVKLVKLARPSSL